MWVARDKNGSLYLYSVKPYRYKEYSIWKSCVEKTYMRIDSALFPDLKWEDEPVEVGLIELNMDNISK